MALSASPSGGAVFVALRLAAGAGCGAAWEGRLGWVRLAPTAAALGAAAGCAQCGTTVGKLMACTRCRAASYCSGKCQKLHYPVHKVGCRAAGVGGSSGV